jgi:hypothetical protein
MVPIPAEEKILGDERGSAVIAYLPLLIQKGLFLLMERKRR